MQVNPGVNSTDCVLVDDSNVALISTASIPSSSSRYGPAHAHPLLNMAFALLLVYVCTYMAMYVYSYGCVFNNDFRHILDIICIVNSNYIF